MGQCDRHPFPTPFTYPAPPGPTQKKQDNIAKHMQQIDKYEIYHGGNYMAWIH